VPAIIVNNPFDIAVPGLTNLREAITQANGAAGAETIQFAAALYLLGNSAPVPLYSALPPITDDLIIDGTSGVPGQRVTVMPLPITPLEEGQEGPKFRLFEVATPGPVVAVRVNVEFKALTMQGGNANDPGDPHGGAVKMTDANVILDNCFVTGNRATGSGGGLWATGNPSLLTLTKGSVVSNNTAVMNGGGINVNNTTLLLNEGAVVTGNTAGLGGGGVAAFANNFVRIAGMEFVEFDGSNGGVSISSNKPLNGDGGGVLVRELIAGAAVPDVNFLHTTVTGNTAVGAAPQGGGAWTSGRGGGVAAIGGLVVDSDNVTNVTENRQSAPAPATAPAKLGVYLDPAVFGTFAGSAQVFDNEQLP
jgi:hypothetical protein